MKDKKPSVYSLLLKKYPASECVVIAEVSNDSGFSRSRSLDFMVINLWPSRGNSIIGMEQKSWRNDWLKELKNPAKQESHFKYCDYFYLITDEENVAKLEEIPVNWGWFHVKGGKIFTMKAAPSLSAQPIPRGFLCAMLRRSADKTGFIHKDSIQDRIDEAVEGAKTSLNNDKGYKEKSYDQLLDRVEKFEKESGITIQDKWDWRKPEQTAKAVRFILDGGVAAIEERLLSLKTDAQLIIQTIDTVIENGQSTKHTEPKGAGQG